MVDLKGQYEKIKDEIDGAINEVIGSAAFINGPVVKEFQENLEAYLDVEHVIPCANGTDALQIALMAAGLKRGDEVIVPAFTYIATAEVIGLLGLTPVMVDVDEDTFNLTAEIVEAAVTPKTKAIVPVHLFGQCCEMQPLLEAARKHDLFLIEDNAQAIGADYSLPDGSTRKAGTIGEIGTTSFYPAKNLGCFGDGGAIFTDNDELAAKIKMIANHGQSRTYYHDRIGVNSRLDSIQAAVLNIKLKFLDDYAAARNKVAAYYDDAFGQIEELQTPVRAKNSTHVFHQYTLRVGSGLREEFMAYLTEKSIPFSVFYPVPLYKQRAFSDYVAPDFCLPVTEKLCSAVISLPIHTEVTEGSLAHVAECRDFFKSG